MKFRIILLFSIFVSLMNSAKLSKAVKDLGQNLNDKKPEERKLYENLTSSYLIGDAVDSADTSHLTMLVSQQKAMDNFKTIGNWLSDVEEKLDDLRDSVNRRVSDMAIGLQRRNMLLGHYNYVGQSTGFPSLDMTQRNSYANL